MAGGAVQADVEALVAATGVAVGLGDGAGQGGADAAVGVIDVETQVGTAAVGQGVLHFVHDFGVQTAFVERRVGLGAEARAAVGHFGRVQQFAQIEAALFGGFGFDDFEQIGAAD